jgi:hypothetical protein
MFKGFGLATLSIDDDCIFVEAALIRRHIFLIMIPIFVPADRLHPANLAHSLYLLLVALHEAPYPIVTCLAPALPLSGILCARIEVDFRAIVNTSIVEAVKFPLGNKIGVILAGLI